MDVLTLSRLQFAVTVAFHFLFPPLSIGLGVLLVIMEARWLRTRDPFYRNLTRYWARVFALIFALGVASGIVMEFQFGTNWSTYSRFVGDVFGSALAAEGILAFFLESGFLAVVVLGWDRVSPRLHFFSTAMVALGAHLSAVWILVANSWQQTPAGYRLVEHAGGMRAEIVDFWQVVFNPSTLQRLSHVLSACWQAGAFLVLSAAAYWLLRRRHERYALESMRIALPVALAASLLQLGTGHWSAVGVWENQPAKLAAFEGHYAESAPATLWLFGWVDEAEREVDLGLGLPGGLGLLTTGDPDTPIVGLDAFDEADRPPVQPVFQTYHVMVAIGMALIALSLLGVVALWRGTLTRWRWLQRLLLVGVAGPQLAIQTGWFAAEVGRQPWVVYGLLRTRDAFSPNVGATSVAASLALFAVLYALLLALFVYLLAAKIRSGPTDDLAQSEVAA